MTADVLEKPKVTGRLVFGSLRELTWDKDDDESVARAHRAFANGLNSGMAAFETVPVKTWHGMSTEEVSTRTFNKETEQIRMTAQFAGG